MEGFYPCKHIRRDSLSDHHGHSRLRLLLLPRCRRPELHPTDSSPPLHHAALHLCKLIRSHDHCRYARCTDGFRHCNLFGPDEHTLQWSSADA